MKTRAIFTGLLIVVGASGCSVEDNLLAPPAPGSAGGKADTLGADNRQQIDQASDPRVWSWARSTAVLAPRAALNGNGAFFSAYPGTLRDKKSLCGDEPFADEPALGFCSAFLVAPDVVATAGHCVNAVACSDIAVVFDYYRGGASQDPTRIPADRVFQCSEVVDREFVHGGDDFALLRLDRPVAGRTPFAVATALPELGGRVGLLGYPSGVWAKIDTSGRVRRHDGNSFSTFLDSFAGHSGGLVINLDTGVAVGVHVAGGSSNYLFDSWAQCARTARCDGADCVASRECSTGLFAGSGLGSGGSPPSTDGWSCRGHCGAEPGGELECGCDQACADYGDCCADYDASCGDTQEPPACVDGGGVCSQDEDCMAGACECRDGSLLSIGSDGLCRDGLCAGTVEVCIETCAGMGGLRGAEPWCQ